MSDYKTYSIQLNTENGEFIKVLIDDHVSVHIGDIYKNIAVSDGFMTNNQTCSSFELYMDDHATVLDWQGSTLHPAVDGQVPTVSDHINADHEREYDTPFDRFIARLGYRDVVSVTLYEAHDEVVGKYYLPYMTINDGYAPNLCSRLYTLNQRYQLPYRYSVDRNLNR
jgi:hypothetical protein